MTRFRRAAPSVVFVLAVTCSSAPATGVRASDDAKQVVRKYVDAMKREDFAGAIAFRCSAARPSIDQVRYKADFERLRATLGTIQNVDVSTAGDTGILPIATLPGQIQVSYRLVTNHGEHEPIIAITGIENGKRVLCGWGTSEARGLFARSGTIVSAGPSTNTSPRNLLNVAGPPGGVETENSSLPMNKSNPAELDGWTRAWRNGNFGGARITALRYVGPDNALSATDSGLQHLQGQGVDVFTVPGVPHAVGIRIVMFSSFWLQDGGTPPFIDEVSAVFGNVLLNVGVSNLTTSSHALAIRLMQEIAARAKP